MAAESLPTTILEQLVRSCGEPALFIREGGTIAAASPAVGTLFPGLADPEGRLVEELLGLGWRALEPVAREGASDLVINLAAGAVGVRGPRSARVTPQRVRVGGQAAILAYLELPVGRSRDSEETPEGSQGGPQASGADPFASLQGDDPGARQAVDLARRFATTDLPILLLAETGTGKDLLARSIHRASRRAGGPFVAINCGGLSPHLLESELFGYGPGAFTGARRGGQDGKVGAADGGTLFLDEVAEMPGALQAILLRFLEDGTFYRIGENRLRHADVRLVCATCRDLPGLVADGAFRRDLFYRIKGACITLPPLRERRDRSLLAQFLLEALAREHRLPSVPRLSPDARSQIEANPWPGNVRELKNALYHALVLAEGDIQPQHLPTELALANPPQPTGTTPASRLTDLPDAIAGSQPSSAAPEAPTSLQDAEARALHHALEASEGNLSAAARILGVARSTLYRLMERHGLRDA